MTADDDLVMGEPRTVLREALSNIRSERRPDGGVEFEFELPPCLGDPFLRALQRTCDELAADDRRRGVPVRRGQQLQTAAFMALLLRVTDTA